MWDKNGCSYAFLEYMREGKYYEALRCAHAMLEDFGEVVRHHEMLLSVNLRRENIAAALENCNEICSYGRLKGLDVAEYESHRETLLLRLSRTRRYLAARFWEEVREEPAAAPSRYAAVPLIVAGEGNLLENKDNGNLFLVFFAHGQERNQIACRLAPCEKPFVAEMAFPRWAAVHCRFLGASDTVILLAPCYYLDSFDTPVQ